ncbi:MAG TPA: hypothetical protein VJV78_03390 [Polyangiales bacterium]|nr:hypothetical protein [Polyangiales bacterium]
MRGFGWGLGCLLIAGCAQEHHWPRDTDGELAAQHGVNAGSRSPAREKPAVSAERFDAGPPPAAANEERPPSPPAQPDGASVPSETEIDAGSEDVASGSAVALSTMGQTTCALMADRTVRCWGDNSTGALGNGTNTNSSVAVQAQGLEQVVQIDLGYLRACALLSDGTLRCWGDNNWGALRNGNQEDQNVPVPVLGVEHVAQISLGESQACARHTDNTLECWLPGVQREGLLDANGATDVVNVEAGYFVTAAWFADGSMRSWGEHALKGSLADASIRQFTSGYAFQCALLANGKVHCKGTYDVHDGVGAVEEFVAGLSDVASISSGFEHTCAVTKSGKVQCWGRNADGQLGNGNTVFTTQPTVVAGLDRVVEVACGRSHSCARTSAGSVYCWGDNKNGELGDGTTVKRLTPVAVQGL